MSVGNVARTFWSLHQGDQGVYRANHLAARRKASKDTTQRPRPCATSPTTRAPGKGTIPARHPTRKRVTKALATRAE